MADSAAFDFVCAELERETSLDRLEARGTVRLALKEAGLEARSVNPDQIGVVVDKLLPSELEARGIEGAAALCARIKTGLANVAAGDQVETPDAVFQRLGSSA
jgi:hypothetical protein